MGRSLRLSKPAKYAPTTPSLNSLVIYRYVVAVNPPRGSFQGQKLTSPIGGGLPTSLIAHNNDLFPFMWAGMMASSHVREIDAVMPERMMAEFPNATWERTRQQDELAFRLLSDNQEAHEQSGRSSDAQTNASCHQACALEHRLAEIGCLPAAWHGAIDHAAKPWIYESYDFWRLEDFLTRFGFCGCRQKEFSRWTHWKCLGEVARRRWCQR